jgi:hypothetical protein
LDAIEVWGRAAFVGRVVVDWLNAIDVWGRLVKDEGGRLPGPMLFAKLLFEALRDETDVGRDDDVEDAKEVFRAPTRDVPLTGGRGAAIADRPNLAGSPARSTRVFLFGSGSLTKRIEAAGQSKHPRYDNLLYSQDKPLSFVDICGGGIAEALDRALL